MNSKIPHIDLIQASTVLEAENSYTRPQYYLANKYV